MIGRHAIVVTAMTLAMLTGTGPAQAHKMKVFASATGAVISGYAYFTGDSRAIQSKVTMAGPDRGLVFEGLTDDLGQFAFQAIQRMDHLITVESGDGHMASFTISAAELPDSLPDSGTAPMPASIQVDGTADLRTLVDQSIARQIRPLREQLDAYQQKIWWHDVIGGIGYIVGLAGLAFGLANRKPRPSPPRSTAGAKEGVTP